MRILITGNMGYIGSVLVPHLRRIMPSSYLIGFDSGFFGQCLTAATTLPEVRLDAQYFGDVRSIADSLLVGVDAIVHLAAVSNDPMGSKFESATWQINHRATVEMARRALSVGVKRFVFASSCSIYGYAEGRPRKETDTINPLTAYAKSKVATEEILSKMELGDATVTSLRFPTACGMSDRLRLDLVLNDFVASAIATRNIRVLSDGTPWRPLIDVKDICRAIEWALARDPRETGCYVAVNVGADHLNFQVRELASAVAEAIPGTTVSINTDAVRDGRSYRVDFSLFKQIAPSHQPQVSLQQTIMELKVGIERMGFNDPNFRASQFMRLKALEEHIESGRLTRELTWR